MIYKVNGQFYKPVRQFESGTDKFIGWAIGCLDDRGFLEKVRDTYYPNEETCKTVIQNTYPGGEWSHALPKMPE